ncbi:AAA family ATPase [Pseudoalteromonas sp. DL-6]|uniref:AAA family ATPase n=1 Tax=Pseudoalteromonas sp. DL-6 TaxID=1390185 RepID=UPI001038D920|nr:AAA family ATPase [Pseudoalteromonas sp. DL-6]QBJ63528.1 hypothetical protein B1F84_11065 [Pseudoalteromonas sp. DL-6]
MITNFEIENFKSFASKQSLPFAPITLIFGPNSSGKSSIIQSLMMLKQTLCSESKRGELITSGDSIVLGTYESLVNIQDNNKKMSFSLHYDGDHDAEEFKNTYSYNLLFSNSSKRSVKFEYRSFNNYSFLNKFNFSVVDKNIEKVNFTVSAPIDAGSEVLYKLDGAKSLRNAISQNYKLKSTDGNSYTKLDTELTKPFNISGRYNLPASRNEPSSILYEYTEKVADDIGYVLDSLKYLGPLRSSPKKFYSSETDVYQKGLGKQNLGLALRSLSVSKRDKINKFLKEFNIPYEIDIKDLGDINTGPLISLQLKDLRNNVVITPKDVGFGIGQVLPIIFEAVVSDKNSICVEQPEIHLHPRLQAHLADLFIDSVESGKNQWIVETHSEALMLRIQRRIREKRISKEMISVLYVDVGETGAQVTRISLDDDGDFTTAWPEGFFEERLNEIFGE